jgi:hypothetical protein
MTPAQRARIQMVPGPQRAPQLRSAEQPPLDGAASATASTPEVKA